MTQPKASIFPLSRCDITRCVAKTEVTVSPRDRSSQIKSSPTVQMSVDAGVPSGPATVSAGNYDSPWKERFHSFGPGFLLSLTFSTRAMLASDAGILSAKKSRPFEQKYAQYWLQEDICWLQGHSGIFILPQIKLLFFWLLLFFVGLLLKCNVFANLFCCGYSYPSGMLNIIA